MYKRFLYVVGLTVLLLACEKDWNSLEEWEELYTVYASLNLKDTAQYVRINKIFASKNNPYDLISVADCVNVNADDFKVILEQWQEGEMVTAPIQMYPSTDFAKEEGDFSSEMYTTFKTTERLAVDSEYILRIKNIKTNYEMMASAESFGLRTLHQSFIEKKYFHIAQYKPERLDYNGSLAPGQFEKQIQRLLYLEISADDTLEKILDWRPWLEHYKQSQEDTASQFIDAYFKYISQEIQVNPNVKRIAIGVDKLLILNSEEFQLFIDLNNTGSSLHYNPDYSNFDKGAGFVGFRYYYTFFGMDLKDETLDSLSFGRFTGDLNFADAEGNWY